VRSSDPAGLSSSTRQRLSAGAAFSRLHAATRVAGDLRRRSLGADQEVPSGPVPSRLVDEAEGVVGRTQRKLETLAEVRHLGARVFLVRDFSGFAQLADELVIGGPTQDFFNLGQLVAERKDELC
jgi:hypothetical protein